MIFGSPGATAPGFLLTNISFLLCTARNIAVMIEPRIFPIKITNSLLSRPPGLMRSSFGMMITSLGNFCDSFRAFINALTNQVAAIQMTERRLAVKHLTLYSS